MSLRKSGWIFSVWLLCFPWLAQWHRRWVPAARASQAPFLAGFCLDAVQGWLACCRARGRTQGLASCLAPLQCCMAGASSLVSWQRALRRVSTQGLGLRSALPKLCLPFASSDRGAIRASLCRWPLVSNHPFLVSLTLSTFLALVCLRTRVHFCWHTGNSKRVLSTYGLQSIYGKYVMKNYASISRCFTPE